jgi:hypothetical protein
MLLTCARSGAQVRRPGAGHQGRLILSASSRREVVLARLGLDFP